MPPVPALTPSHLARDDAGRLVVPQPLPAAGRLFGALFMLPGFKLAWDLVNAIVEVTRAGDWRLTDVLSFGVWLLVILVIVLPGWIIATLRRTVVIDPGHRTVVQTNDFILYRWRSARRLDEFHRVRLFIPPSPSSSRKRTGVSHHVELTARTGKPLIAFMDDSEDRARAVAHEIAAACGLAMRDDVAAGRGHDVEDTESEDA